MISSVTFKSGDSTYVLKMSARAGMALEEDFDLPITKFAGLLNEDMGFRKLVRLAGPLLADGAGADEAAALQFVDTVGFNKALELVGEAMTAAFPQEEDPGANKAPADRKRRGNGRAPTEPSQPSA